MLTLALAISGEFSMSFSGGSTTRHLAPAHFAPKYLRKGRLCHYYLVPVLILPLYLFRSWACSANKPETVDFSNLFLYLFEISLSYFRAGPLECIFTSDLVGIWE